MGFMMLHQKSFRRLKLMFLAGLVLAVGAAGAYVLRVRYLEHRAVVLRAQGLEELKSGDYYNALHHIGPYVQRHPDDVDTLLPYARARKNVEEPDGKHLVDAMRVYRRILDLKHDDVDAARDLIEIYQANGFDTETVTVADLVLKRLPDDAAAAIAKAGALARMRRFEDASKALKHHLELQPLDVEGQILALSVMGRSGKPPEQLVRYAEQLGKEHPHSAVPPLLASAAYGMANKRDAAGDAALKAAAALTAGPATAPAKPRPAQDPLLVMAVARQLDAVEQFDAASALLQKAAIGAEDVRLQQMLVARWYQTKRYDAVLAFNAGANADDPELTAYRCLALARLNRSAEAEAVARQLGERKFSPMAMAWSGVLLAHLSPDSSAQVRGTIKVCTEALKRLPRQPIVHQMLAAAFAASGDADVSLRHWQEAVLSAPAWAEPLDEFARQLIRAGRVDDAAAAAQAARRRAPQDVAPMLTLAQAWSVAVRGGRKQLQPDLLALIDDIQKRDPSNERVIPIRVQLLAQMGKRQAAIDAVNAALNSQKVPSESTLLQLAAISKDEGLGTTERCLAHSEKVHGLTPDLAYVRAKQLHDDGRTQDGLRLLDGARQKGGDTKKWGIAWAKFLEVVQDGRARDEWIALADRFPDSTDLQWIAVSAPSVQQDRAFVGRILERLRAQIGESGVTWRLKRAQYLLQGQDSSKDAVQAALILNEVSRSAPDLLAPRLMLATCLERLGNISGAIEQLSIARNLQPNASGLRLELARLYQQRDDFARAKTELEPFITGSLGTTAEQRRNAALLLARQGETDASLKLLETTTNVKDLPADLALAIIYRRRQETQKVDAIVAKLLAPKEVELPVITFAADYYSATGRPREAEAALGKLDCLKAAPGKKQILRGDFLNAHGKTEDALAQYQAATKAAPQDAATWRQLVTCYLGHNRADEFVAALKQAGGAIPNDKGFAAALAQSGCYTASAAQDKHFMATMLVWLLQNPEDEPALAEAMTAAVAAVTDPAAATRLPSLLRATADRSPRVLPLQMYASFVCLAAGRNEDAIRISMRAMELAPNGPEPAKLASAALAAGNKWNELLAVAQKWSNRSGEQTAPADVMVALAQNQLGNYAAAKARLKPYLARGLDKPEEGRDVLYQYARAEIGSGKAERAAELYRPFLDRSPEWRTAWMRLAVVDLGEPSASAAWLRELEAHIPADSFMERLGLLEGWQMLSRMSGQAAHAEVATSLLAKLTSDAESKGTAEAWLSIGCMQESQGDITGAERSYRRTLQLNANFAIAQNNLAMLLARQDKQLEEAAMLAEHAAKTPGAIQASAYDTLAFVRGKRHEYPAAIEAINRGLALVPNNVTLQLRLATLLADHNQIDKARAVVEEIKSLPDVRQSSPEIAQELRALEKRLAVDDVPSARAS
jgi:predicted Zn-dependent protease